MHQSKNVVLFTLCVEYMLGENLKPTFINRAFWFGNVNFQ